MPRDRSWVMSSVRNETPASRSAVSSASFASRRLSSGLKILPTAVSGISFTMWTRRGRAARSPISRARKSRMSASRTTAPRASMASTSRRLAMPRAALLVPVPVVFIALPPGPRPPVNRGQPLSKTEMSN
jgi:hypothetical protein